AGRAGGSGGASAEQSAARGTAGGVGGLGACQLGRGGAAARGASVPAGPAAGFLAGAVARCDRQAPKTLRGGKDVTARSSGAPPDDFGPTGAGSEKTRGVGAGRTGRAGRAGAPPRRFLAESGTGRIAQEPGAAAGRGIGALPDGGSGAAARGPGRPP